MDSEDEKSSSRSSHRKPKKSGKAESIEWADTNATVIEVLPGFCRVRVDPLNEAPEREEWLCRYRRADVWGHYRDPRDPEVEWRERAPVAVGDRVVAERVGGPKSRDGIVAGVAARRNRLVRPAPAREDRILHVIAANVEQLVIVASAKNPDFTAGLIDRFLIAAQAQGIEAILCINKVDLLSEGEAKAWEVYSQLGLPIFETCAKSGLGIDALRAKLGGRTSVFAGKSGVGKTSLLKVLTGREIGKVGEVSSATGKGKHTTTSSVMLPVSDGSQWIDTPGVREFGLLGVSPEELKRYYPEFEGLLCTGRGCEHRSESECQALLLPRHASYVRILLSLVAGER